MCDPGFLKEVTHPRILHQVVMGRAQAPRWVGAKGLFPAIRAKGAAGRQQHQKMRQPQHRPAFLLWRWEYPAMLRTDSYGPYNCKYGSVQ